MAKIMRRKYICKNGVVETTQFLVGDKQQGGSRWHRAKSQEDKRDENARQAVRVVARVLNCNYTPEDFLLTLTYSDESMEALFPGMTPDEILEAAKGQLSRRLEQVRRGLRRSGADLEAKTLSVTADMDGETGEMVRIHHHVVCTAAGARELEEKWDLGLVHTENLYRQDDYTPLAAYLLDQVRHREGKKKYSCSRNMEKPIVEEQVLERDPETEIRVQPGAKVLDRTPYRVGCVSQYVRYKRKPRAAKRGGHKKENSICGRSDDQSNAKGGSGYEFSKISWD